MSELKKIQDAIQSNFNNLNDKKRSLAKILAERRINSGNQGAVKFIDEMTQRLDGVDQANAEDLLENIIGNKNLIENSKKKT